MTSMCCCRTMPTWATCIWNYNTSRSAVSSIITIFIFDHQIRCLFHHFAPLLSYTTYLRHINHDIYVLLSYHTHLGCLYVKLQYFKISSFIKTNNLYFRPLDFLSLSPFCTIIELYNIFTTYKSWRLCVVVVRYPLRLPVYEITILQDQQFHQN